MAEEYLTDLKVLAEDVLSFLETSTKSSAAISKNSQEISNQATEISKLYESVSRDVELITRQKGLAELEVQKANQKAAAAAGAVPGAEHNILNKLISEVTNTTVGLTKNFEQVRKEKEMNFLDNPVDYVKNQIFESDAEIALKNDVEKLKLLDAQVGIINKSLQDTARTNAALAQPITQATIEASANVAASEAVVRARQARIEALKYDSLSVKELMDSSKDRINAIIQLRGAINAEENQAFQREQFEAIKADRAARTELAKQAKEEKAALQQIDDQTLNYINLSKAAIGQPTLTAEEFKFHNTLLKQGKSPELAHHLENGMRIAMTGKSSIGQTPAESLAILKQIPSNLPDIRQETAKLIADAERIVLGDPKVDKKDKNAVAQSINDLVQQSINQQYNVITKESVFNIGELANYLEKDGKVGIGDLHALPISQKILLPAIRANQPLDDAKTIMGLVYDGVSTGKITSSEALGISEIYRKASLINQEARGFHAFGITVPGGGTAYNVKLGGGLFGGSVINLNDPVAVSRYISSALATSVYGTSADQLNSSFLGAP